MKKVILKEDQLPLLIEAMKSSFSFYDLKNMTAFNEMFEYCKKHLGEELNRGSSRVAFQIDDQWCLKLALNEKGIAQNKEEITLYKLCQRTRPLYASIHEDLSDLEEYKFIVAEYCLEACEEDFDKVLGISFNDVCWFAFISENMLNDNKYGCLDYDSPDHIRRINQYYRLRESNPFFKMLDMHIQNDVMTDDLQKINSWGLVNRDNKPMIVILDYGLSNEVFDNYYGN